MENPFMPKMIVYAGKARGECVTNSRAELTSSGPLDHGCGNLVNDRLCSDGCCAPQRLPLMRELSRSD